MIIQNVTEADAGKLLEIYSVYVTDTAVSFEYDVPTEEEFRERIRRITAGYPYLKAVDAAGEILGYAYAGPFHERKAYERSVETTVYIRQDARRSGTGRLLYEALETRLRERGILNLYACIATVEVPDVYLTNDSRHFHEAMGFTLAGRFRQCGFKFGRWYDMIWMEKLIGPHKTE